MNVIAIPTKTRERMERVVTQREVLNAQLDAIVLTLRDTLNVPDGYTLTDINVGFVPAPEPATPAPVQEQEE